MLIFVARKLKWVLFHAGLLCLYLLGRVVCTRAGDPRSVLVMGDVSYTGGTWVYFVSLVDMLISESFRVSILMPRRYAGRILEEFARSHGVRLFVIPDTFAFVEYLAELWNAWKLRASRVVVSASGPGNHTRTLLWGIPSVQVMHSMAGAGVPPRARRLIRLFLKPPHRMVGVSRVARDSLCRSFRIPTANQRLVRTVYNGVPDRLSQEGRPPVVRDLVVTLGHVAEHKNPSTWLLAAEDVLRRARTKPRFIWAGDGPELSEYQRRVEGRTDIQFVGYRKDGESLLERALVYYQPSLMESFGLAVAQAMSVGVPCVVSDRGGLPEVVTAGCSGFVCASDDWRSQSQAILNLLEDGALWTRMSVESRKLYLERFTDERWRREILELLAQPSTRTP